MTIEQRDDVFWDAAKRQAINRRLHNHQKRSGRGEKAALMVATTLLSLSVFVHLRTDGSIALLFINHWPEVVLLLFIVAYFSWLSLRDKYF